MKMKPLLFLTTIFFYSQYTFPQTFSPPSIKKQTKFFNEHNGQRVDDYYWMNNPADQNVIAHLNKENAYTESYMKHTEVLQAKLYDEIVARIPGKDQSLPTKKNGYWYYSRFEEGKQYPYLLRRKETMTSPEEIFLDIPMLAKPYKTYLLRGWSISNDNDLLAYGIDTAGDRRSILYITNLSEGKLYNEHIPNTSGVYVWANDNKTLYYVLNDPTVRAYKVMRHKIGTDAMNDKMIYLEKDSTYGVSIYKSKNNKYIFITSESTNTTEASYIDADAKDPALVIIQPREKDVEYHVNNYEPGVFHIYTNRNAKNFKYVTAPVKNPAMNNWKEIIPHNDKAFLQKVVVLKNYYLAQTKENGLTQINFFDRNKAKWHSVPFGQEDYVADMYMATDEYATDSIRYYFTSLTTPGTEYMYNLETGERKLLKQTKIGGNFNPALYETKRLWATASDGTKIPISYVYRKDKFKKDGSNPLLLYAYGSYGANSDPFFQSSVVSLLDRGIGYAIAHIRGGQEMGRDWYEQGRLMHKKNTFSDFVNAAHFLVNEKYTSSDKLFANGGSAGGMLMGAIVNMRPDLFKGVIAEVPWMDVITDMYNTDLPLTTLEYDQWGDPNNKEYYDYMLTWSPLDNVHKAKYPAILATGGLNDTQVPFYSPAKWVAKVRENNLGGNPVLLKINMGAGHGGASGRFESQKLTALKYAFILDQLGIKE